MHSLYSLLAPSFGTEKIYSERANSVRISHTAVEQRVLLFHKAFLSPEGESNKETWFWIFKWDRTHEEGFSQNTAMALTLHIKQDAWTFLDQNVFKDV